MPARLINGYHSVNNEVIIMNTVSIAIKLPVKWIISWLPLWKNYQIFSWYLWAIKRTWEPLPIQSSRYSVPSRKVMGELVGLHIIFFTVPWAESDYCYLEDLYVSENIRGKHIGKLLIECSRKEARKRHASHLYWHTHEANYRAQRLWLDCKKSGMIEYRMQVR